MALHWIRSMCGFIKGFGAENNVISVIGNLIEGALVNVGGAFMLGISVD